LLTFGLLIFVAYQTIIVPRIPKLALYVQRVAPDTKTWSWRADFIDFVLENRGKELSNVRISSTPDDIGWERFDTQHPGRKTSEHFAEAIPYLGEGERRQFPWCESRSNEEKVGTPFSITVEYDDPLSLWKRRGKRTFKFNLASLRGTRGGWTRRYDEHNIAQECARIREQLEVLNSNFTAAISEALQGRPSDSEESS
jgi:hypothetical protein